MVANFSHFSIISFKKRQLGGICCPPMGMSVFLETALQCAKKKLGCKGNSSHEMFITLLLRFFAPYFLFQFSHSLVYLRSIDKEEKAAQF